MPLEANAEHVPEGGFDALIEASVCENISFLGKLSIWS